MAAPTATARTTPSGSVFKNGYQSLITFAADADIALWETEIGQPFGDEGGDPVDLTTMHNSTRRTKAPRGLIDTEGGTVTCAFNATSRAQCRTIINTETTITITLPDGSTMADFGYMRSFKPTGFSDGSMPLAEVGIEFTGRDSSGAEQEPVVA